MQDILGLDVNFGETLPDDPKSELGFTNNGSALQASSLHLDYFQNIAREALEKAITQYGPPEIFNTDQGSQFTSVEFTQVLKDHGVKISMDGKGRWVDNVFVERLWKSVKYEHVYLHAYDSVSEAKQQLAGYFEFYNTARPHSSLGGQTPDTAYCGNGEWKNAA